MIFWAALLTAQAVVGAVWCVVMYLSPDHYTPADVQGDLFTEARAA